MANEVEASKILRMRRELSESRDLTAVTEDNAMFEVATNSHFNNHMNEIVRLENEQNDRIKSDAGANLALDKIRVMLSGQNSPS